MDELRIVRGKDVTLYAGNAPLFGVTEFSAVEKPRCHKVYEFFSPSPHAYIPQGAVYEIRLSMLTLFDGQLPDGSFDLRVAYGSGGEYRYGSCRVAERRADAQGNRHAVTTVLIEADELVKRGMEDD